MAEIEGEPIAAAVEDVVIGRRCDICLVLLKRGDPVYLADTKRGPEIYHRECMKPFNAADFHG